MFNIFKRKLYTNLDSQTFKRKLKRTKKPFLLDVRSPQEFKEEKIPNAYNISIIDPNFKAKIDNLNKQRPYFLYCQTGARSRKACRILTKHGFKEVYNLKGGLKNWEGLTV